MGPSGCGKSSLLAALSGTCDRKLDLSGDLRIDGERVERADLGGNQSGVASTPRLQRGYFADRELLRLVAIAPRTIRVVAAA